MEIKDDEKFIMNVESLIDPAEVSNLFFFSSLKKMLPKSLFKKLLVKTSKKTPYMGFVIEPYSTFLFYKLKDIEKAKSMLPERYELAKAKIFESDKPEYLCGMGVFNSRASTFWGSRLESYLIARDKETGLLSWMFVDIFSNTLIAHPKEGITSPNTERAVFTISSRGDIYIDFKKKNSDDHITVKANIKNGTFRNMGQEIWVMGNTSIGHSVDMTEDYDDPFAVIFDPAEVEEALDIPLSDVEVRSTSLFSEIAEPELYQVACFPYAQHYMADSPGCRTYVKTSEDLVENYNKISEMKGMKTFSTKAIKFQFFAGIILSALLAVVFGILWMFG
jgi:hypothetical protein